MSGDGGWFLDLGGRRTPIAQGQTVIGRGRDCDLVLADATVSRNHALLSLDGGRLTLQDLDSANGTFVGGERVRTEVSLAAGSRLRFGRVRGSVVRGGPGEAPASVRFCVACGAEVPSDARECPRCGEPLDAERRMSRSEAVGVSEVLPVGEALASPTRGLDETRPPFPLAWEPDLAATGVRPAPAAVRPLGPAGDQGAGEAAAATQADDRPAADGAAAIASRTEVEATADSAPGPAAPPGEAERVVGEETGDQDEASEDRLGGAVTADRSAGPRFLPAAGFWSRAAAALADAVWLSALGAAVAVAPLAAGRGLPSVVGTAAATAVVAWLLVSVVGWSRWGTTPGKRLLHLWVCDLDGRPGIGPGRALGRWLGYLASAALGGVGFLLVGLSASRRALHDRLAGTYVGHWRGDAGARRRG